jgi:phosphoribosylformylglycinamidine synthase
LNFGNPTRPEVFHQFTEAVAGMAEACAALGTPVTGGNVSFYNENPSGAVYPTPVIGMLGVLDDVGRATASRFRHPGEAIVLLGEPTDELGASEYLARIHGVAAGAPPACDLTRERAVIDSVLDAINSGLVSAAHDCSEGGLAVALAECAIGDRAHLMAADVDLSAWSALPLRALLFGEAQGRILVATSDPAAVIAIAARHGAPARRIGQVQDERTGDLTIRVGAGEIRAPVERLARAYHDAIPTIMRRGTAESVPEAAILEQHPQPASV